MIPKLCSSFLGMLSITDLATSKWLTELNHSNSLYSYWSDPIFYDVSPEPAPVYPETIAWQISRLQDAKACIKAAIEEKWVTIWSDVTLDWYADCIGEISSWWGWQYVELLVVWWGWWGPVFWWWGGGWWVIYCTNYNLLESEYPIVIWSWWDKNTCYECSWCNWWDSCFWTLVACWWWWGWTGYYCWCPWCPWWSWGWAWMGEGRWVRDWWCPRKELWYIIAQWWQWWVTAMFCSSCALPWAWWWWAWWNWWSVMSWCRCWWRWWSWVQLWISGNNVYYWAWWWWSGYSRKWDSTVIFWWSGWTWWWWRWWRRFCTSYDNCRCAWCNWTCYWAWWWWGWESTSYPWWCWYQWIVIVRYHTDGSDWITSATGWCKYTCGDYTIHCFTSNWTFCITW